MRRLLALCVLAFGCGGSAESAKSQGPPPAAVEVADARLAPIDEGFALVGQIEAGESVMIRPETRGVVAEIGFTEGQEVTAGTVLFRLRDAEQRARVAEAEAQVGLTAQAFARARSLAGERILSAAELDEAVANRDAARARLDMAAVELARTQIRAPFDGVLGRRLVSPGDRVTDETDLVQIDAVAELKLLFTLPEPIIGAARVGMPVRLAVSAYPGEQFDGTVFFVAPTLDPANRRMLLKATVPNPDRRLRPGMFANLRLETDRRPDALVVPESAIVYDPEGTFVWRVTPETTVERVTVSLGLRRDGMVEVTSGLAAGDRVVSAGTNKVAPGRTVAITEPPAPAS